MIARFQILPVMGLPALYRTISLRFAREGAAPPWSHHKNAVLRDIVWLRVSRALQTHGSQLLTSTIVWQKGLCREDLLFQVLASSKSSCSWTQLEQIAATQTFSLFCQFCLRGPPSCFCYILHIIVSNDSEKPDWVGLFDALLPHHLLGFGSFEGALRSFILFLRNSRLD